MITSFLQLQEVARERTDQNIKNLIDGDHTDFFRLVRKIEIPEKSPKGQVKVHQQVVYWSGLQVIRNDYKLQIRSRPSKIGIVHSLFSIDVRQYLFAPFLWALRGFYDDAKNKEK